MPQTGQIEPISKKKKKKVMHLPRYHKSLKQIMIKLMREASNYNTYFGSLEKSGIEVTFFFRLFTFNDLDISWRKFKN